MQHKKAQVTIFIIIAILVVAAALFSYFFYFRPKIDIIPSEIRPVENYFIDCVNTKVKEASQIAGLQGGYLELPEFEPGSEYLPFSSQLNFVGLQMPYWFYVSGNNLAKEQKPELREIEKQFSDYLAERIKDECDLDFFSNQGYDIEVLGEPGVSVNIKEKSIETVVSWSFRIGFSDTQITISEHKVSTKSNFGSLYNTASKIFETEQEKLFLEDYAIDVLRLYAPVTGIELSCSPKVWLESSVKEEIDNALEANMAAVKVSGSYYDLGPGHDYFEVDVGKEIDEQVFFLYSKDMPHVFSVWPSEDGVMKAEPIGLQPGLGILSAVGFCYVPYHFIYDLKFPVVVEIIEGEEIFQFPVVVVIDKNSIRNATAGESEEIVLDICKYKSQEVNILTYNENSEPLEAEINFKCFNQVCDLGDTKIAGGKASLTTVLPKCYNGFLIAKASGYVDSKLQISSTESFTANMFLNPVHTLNVEITGLKTGEYAVVSFVSKDYSTSLYYPEQKEINLGEGTYDVSVQLFKDSLIKLEKQIVEKCIEVPATGIAGVFGAKSEQCFELDIPEESLTNVLFGGGKAEFSVTESELRQVKKIRLDVDSFDIPTNLFELGDIYGLIEISEVGVVLS